MMRRQIDSSRREQLNRAPGRGKCELENRVKCVSGAIHCSQSDKEAPAHTKCSTHSGITGEVHPLAKDLLNRLAVGSSRGWWTLLQRARTFFESQGP